MFKKILIIDDEKNILRSLSLILEAEGFKVFVAKNLKEAKRILAQEDKPKSKLPEGRTPLSDDWFREKAAVFSYDDIRPMDDDERQRAKQREEANKCTP